MANGLLDYIQDFDINKALGVQYGLPKGMLSPEIESQMGVGGTLGGVTNVIQGMQQGAGTPENIFRFLTGQKSGRQNVINTATQNYLNQLNIAKLQGDIAQDPYKLSKLKFEVEKAPYEIGELQNKFYQSSFKTKSIKSEFKKLEDEGRTDELNTLLANPDKYFELKQTTDINKMQYSQPELSAARILNLNVRDRKNWNEQNEINYNAIISAPSQQEANRLNVDALIAHKDHPNRVPYIYTPSRNEIISDIRKQNKGTTTVVGNGMQKVVEPSFTRIEKQSMPIGEFASTKEYPEGGFKGSDGKIYRPEDWNKLGLEKQNILLRDVTREEYVQQDKLLTENMRTDEQSAQYGFRNADRTNKAIEKILDNPEKFMKLFSTYSGRLPIQINKSTGNFFATESEAQDIVNLLNTIKGQQFTNEIQLMRNNNKTGGAVGNVSDREVSMFQNMAANLDYSGTPEQLWDQLNLLYSQGNKMVNIYSDNFNKYYGESNAKRYGVSNYIYDAKPYDRDLNKVIENKKRNQFNEKIGNVMPSIELTPQGQQPFITNEGFSLAN